MYNLKMSELVRPSAEYDRRAAIIECFSPDVRNIAQKYTDAEKSEEGSANPVRQSHSREKTARTQDCRSKSSRAHFGRPRSVASEIVHQTGGE